MSYRKKVLIPFIKSVEEREKQIENKYKNCRHPHRKMGCCDNCGKDLIGE
jgi:hypothetical protein